MVQLSMELLDREYNLSLLYKIKDYLKKYPRSKVKVRSIEIDIEELDTQELEWCLDQYEKLLFKFDLNIDFISIFLNPKDKDIHLKMVDSTGKIKDISSKK